MWHSSVSPTREYDLAGSLSGSGKSEYSSGCDLLNSGRLEGIQFSFTGVETASVLVCFVKPSSGITAVVGVGVMVGISLDCGCDLSGTLTDDGDWFSDLWYLNDLARESL